MLDVRSCATLSEAAGILSGDRQALLIAGGTLVMRDVNEGRLTEGTLLRVTDPAFRQVNAGGARVEIGAGVTMAAVLANRDLAYLHAAARAIGGPAIRTMATIGGNLFAETPYGDFTVALLALGAEVVVQAGYGSGRAVPLEDFLAGRERGGAGQAQGLVTAVQFTRPQNPSDFLFRKISRVKPKGISVLSIAAHLPASGGRLVQPRVAYGAMAPVPMRARGVERVLDGKPLDQAAIQAAKQAALEGTRPATDAIASDWYRREILPVHLGRLLAGEPR
ncbi:FAD binding domain-containing protein [Bosea sp. BH3]|uniref:FAD binding domain-containing protein n=1 Tax=Bosea sp. BH3 TaxID=2871701 RepID=UPI0021CB61D1|nr:FAD binding domain-containing protein [Bosea sp. BH3]MCU4182056.1 FAD binding domain-containing protein [Bosea sp. BH3]